MKAFNTAIPRWTHATLRASQTNPRLFEQRAATAGWILTLTDSSAPRLDHLNQEPSLNKSSAKCFQDDAVGRQWCILKTIIINRWMSAGILLPVWLRSAFPQTETCVFLVNRFLRISSRSRRWNEKSSAIRINSLCNIIDKVPRPLLLFPSPYSCERCNKVSLSMTRGSYNWRQVCLFFISPFMSSEGWGEGGSEPPPAGQPDHCLRAFKGRRWTSFISWKVSLCNHAFAHTIHYTRIRISRAFKGLF